MFRFVCSARPLSLSPPCIQPWRQPVGDTPPWCFEQLCRAAASAAAAGPLGADAASVGGGLSQPKRVLISRMLSRASKDDVTLLAAYLVRTKRAVMEEEEGLLKVFAAGESDGRGWGGIVAAGKPSISETEKDLLHLRCTGKTPPTYLGVIVFLWYNISRMYVNVLYITVYIPGQVEECQKGSVYPRKAVTYFRYFHRYIFGIAYRHLKQPSYRGPLCGWKAGKPYCHPRPRPCPSL